MFGPRVLGFGECLGGDDLNVPPLLGGTYRSTPVGYAVAGGSKHWSKLARPPSVSFYLASGITRYAITYLADR